MLGRCSVRACTGARNKKRTPTPPPNFIFNNSTTRILPGCTPNPKFLYFLIKNVLLLFRNGSSAFKIAIRARVNNPEKQRNNMIIVQHLVDSGVSLTSQDKDGETPLQLAQHWKRDDLYTLLGVKR